MTNCNPDTQNRNHTKGGLLVFAYDFDITVAMLLPMVLASVLMRGIHPLKILKMADVQGGGECLS
jgi:hypothetical protein